MKHKKLILDKLDVIKMSAEKLSGILDGIDGSGQYVGDDEDILIILLAKETIALIKDED